MIINFQIPYFGSYFKGCGELIKEHKKYKTVKVTQGYLKGHTTDISNLYIIK